GAAEKSRTSTGFLPLGPQPSASAIPPRPHKIILETNNSITFFKQQVNQEFHLTFRKLITNFKSAEIKMAGVPGFEPGHDGIKPRCLTAWLYPNEKWRSRPGSNRRSPA